MTMSDNLPVNAFLVFFISLSLTVLVLPRLINIASQIGLIDHPNQRKVHRRLRPLVGGIGMVLGLSMTCPLFIPLSNLKGFYAGLIMLALVGFLDDFRELNHRLKFVAQILASVIMVYFSQTVLQSFGDLFSFGPVNPGVFAIPLTIFCTVGVINAINMIDGLDGLAGGISLIAFISFAILAYINHQMDLMLLSIALSGAVVAFLRYNWHPSRLFMGDAGSLSLGFSLAFLSVAITQKNNSLVPPVAPLLILAIPIVDTVTIMVKRMLSGKSPFHADKYHLHHILLKFGLDKKDAVKAILLLSGVFSTIALIGTIFKVPDYYLFLIFSLYLITYFITSFYLKNMLRFKVRLTKTQKITFVMKKNR